MLADGQGGWHWVASFYGYDDHGSVRYLTDLSGNVTDLYDYDAFGNLIQQGATRPISTCMPGSKAFAVKDVLGSLLINGWRPAIGPRFEQP